MVYNSEMDHVTRATPLSGMISHPKASISHSLQANKILTTVALAVPKIFHGKYNFKFGHGTLTAPFQRRLVVPGLTLNI